MHALRWFALSLLVVVLDHGQVIQRGARAELSGTPGRFRDLLLASGHDVQVPAVATGHAAAARRATDGRPIDAPKAPGAVAPAANGCCQAMVPFCWFQAMLVGWGW